MENEKYHMRTVVAVKVSAAALCAVVVLSIWGEHLSCFPYDASIAKGMWRGTKTWAAVLLMGHLDVWAYVIQSQRAASNHTPIAGILLHGDRFAASLLYPGSHGSGNRSRQGPEACLSLSTSPASTHTDKHTNVPTQYCPTAPAAPGLTLICLKRTK